MRMLLVASLGLALFVVTAHHVFAQTSPQQGISVTPSIIHLDLAQDQPSFVLSYKNTTDTTIQISLHAQDFSPLEDGWKVNYLNSQDAANYKYSLSSWIEFETDSFTLSPNDSATVKVFIQADQLAIGAHYGMILAEANSEQAKTNVAIHAILSSLVLVRTNTGKEVESGQIESFKTVRDYLALPYRFAVRFKNAGNVDLTPYGTITITNWFGRKVSSGIVNEASLVTLPESIRRYDVPVTTTSRWLLPGIYTAKIDLHFGKTNQTVQATTTFLSLGMFSIKEVLLLAGLLVSICYGIRKYHHRKH